VNLYTIKYKYLEVLDANERGREKVRAYLVASPSLQAAVDAANQKEAIHYELQSELIAASEVPLKNTPFLVVGA
jgi:hypothetical protein